MKALILNSGLGTRMGELTKKQSKCLTNITDQVTILDLQLKKLEEVGITDVVMTTGAFSEELMDYIRRHFANLSFTFVHNSIYQETNYIYSIVLAKDHLDDDIVLMHGDLVFETSILKEIIEHKTSAIVVDKKEALPEKDFKAVLNQNRVEKIGIDFFDNAYAAQPLYKVLKREWNIWLKEMEAFCNRGCRNIYAENALNTISDKMNIQAFDINGRICTEIDNTEDLERVKSYVNKII